MGRRSHLAIGRAHTAHAVGRPTSMGSDDNLGHSINMRAQSHNDKSCQCCERTRPITITKWQIPGAESRKREQVRPLELCFCVIHSRRPAIIIERGPSRRDEAEQNHNYSARRASKRRGETARPRIRRTHRRAKWPERSLVVSRVHSFARPPRGSLRLDCNNCQLQSHKIKPSKLKRGEDGRQSSPLLSRYLHLGRTIPVARNGADPSLGVVQRAPPFQSRLAPSRHFTAAQASENRLVFDAKDGRREIRWPIFELAEARTSSASSLRVEIARSFRVDER